MKRYRKQILAGLAGYRVVYERTPPSSWNAPWTVINPRGHAVAVALNPGEAWYRAYTVLQYTIKQTGKP